MSKKVIGKEVTGKEVTGKEVCFYVKIMYYCRHRVYLYNEDNFRFKF